MKLNAILILLAVLSAVTLCSAAEPNLIANGSFEEPAVGANTPRDWAAAGNPRLKQTVTFGQGRDGKRCARLECTEFSGDGSDFHVMVCQVGRIAVRRGQWYRLAFWARGDGIKVGSVEIALVNTRVWSNAGLAEAFNPSTEWQRFEFLFRPAQDLPADSSRLQFWFKSAGTLELDDLELAASATGQQWYPQVATDGIKNFVPNSSFECGGGGWGSYTWGLGGWAGNLYRLEAEPDSTVAWHGGHSLRIALNPQTVPVFWFDYYEPIRQPVKRVLAANRGWFPVKPGEKLTLSAWLRADATGTVAQLAVIEAPDRSSRKAVQVGTTWQRHTFTFSPSQPFLFIGVGLDLEESRRESAVLWIDAIQLERGDQATAYSPRQPLETLVETPAPGNTFTNALRGATVMVQAFNDSDQPQTLRGELTISDFFGKEVQSREIALRVAPHSGVTEPQERLCPDRRGFFRADWSPKPGGKAGESLRFAIIDPAPPGALDSPFGFNHAYPWDFLVRLARQAGVGWWRDWSAKWQTVEPKQGVFDFTIPDAQIRRVLELDSNVEVLLPFPSARWSSTARTDEVEKAAGSDNYLRARLPVAFPPKDLADFGRYAVQVARRYSQVQPRPATTFQILNEPVYTDYALPRKFGYGLEDYLRLLEAAHGALKAAAPNCRVVGGISANVEAGLTRDFITQGGLRFVDVLDLHLYDATRPAETYDEPFARLQELMRSHGGPKPVWITEWGCYADDDPPCVPETVGDATMNRCRWSSERAASEHIVKFATVAFAHGVRKIFFHAGTCGVINGPDAGGVLFEYGGAPRKMLPAVAAFSRLVGVPDEAVKTSSSGALHFYVFRSRGQVVGVAWSSTNARTPAELQLSRGLRAYDLMGNQIREPRLTLTSTPVYLVSAKPESMLNALKP